MYHDHLQEAGFAAVDWDTVGLLQAGQFRQEARYHEERLRWALARAARCGGAVVRMEEDSVGQPSPEGGRTYSVTLRGCRAVARDGGMIDIPGGGAFLRAQLEARQPLVPLFVGVARVEREHIPELHPSTDAGLLGCGGLLPRYRLAEEDSDAAYDWVQVAQFVKTTAGLAPDTTYVPECLFLDAHPRLRVLRREVTESAGQALEALTRHSISDSPGVWGAAIALSGPLGQAAVLPDAGGRPRAYVDALAGVLAAGQAQLACLPDVPLVEYQEAVDHLTRTLETLRREDISPGPALAMIRDAFVRLARVYPALLDVLAGSASSRPSDPSPYPLHDIAVRADGPAAPPNVRPRGGIFRR